VHLQDSVKDPQHCIQLPVNVFSCTAININFPYLYLDERDRRDGRGEEEERGIQCAVQVGIYGNLRLLFVFVERNPNLIPLLNRN